MLDSKFDREARMAPEVKKLWLDALRSGEYIQGRGRLTAIVERGAGEDKEANCCLGVLCELAVRAGRATRQERNGTCVIVYWSVGKVTDVNGSFLPDQVVAWAGLTHNYGTAEPYALVERLPERVRQQIKEYYDVSGHEFVSLSSLNDAGAPFSLIADIIEHAL